MVKSMMETVMKIMINTKAHYGAERLKHGSISSENNIIKK